MKNYRIVVGKERKWR